MEQADSEIIQDVLCGNIERYAKLVEKYQALTLRVAFSLLGNFEDAKDVSQEAFVSAYKSLRSFRGGAKFSSWLYRIVVNRCKDIWRKRSREPQAGAIIARAEPDCECANIFIDVEEPAAGPSERAANQELAKHISAAIDRLPMKQRSAFLLHHVHGLSLEEVASILRCRIGTVKSHIFRATTALKLELDPWRKQGGF